VHGGDARAPCAEVDHQRRRLARCERRQHRVLRQEHRGCLELLEHQLDRLLAIFPRHVRWLRDQHRVVLGVHQQGLPQGVVPQLLQDIPVLDQTIFPVRTQHFHVVAAESHLVRIIRTTPLLCFRVSICSARVLHLAIFRTLVGLLVHGLLVFVDHPDRAGKHGLRGILSCVTTLASVAPNIEHDGRHLIATVHPDSPVSKLPVSKLAQDRPFSGLTLFASGTSRPNLTRLQRSFPPQFVHRI